MVGDYDHSRTLLVTDKFAGTVTAAMGFKQTKGIYMPNTALKMDIRDIIKPTSQRRVVAIFTKPRSDTKYKRLTYLGKGMTIEDRIFVQVLKEKVDSENLITGL